MTDTVRIEADALRGLANAAEEWRRRGANDTPSWLRLGGDIAAARRALAAGGADGRDEDAVWLRAELADLRETVAEDARIAGVWHRRLGERIEEERTKRKRLARDLDAFRAAHGERLDRIERALLLPADGVSRVLKRMDRELVDATERIAAIESADAAPVGPGEGGGSRDAPLAAAGEEGEGS